MILAEPFVVRSVIILRLSLLPVLWGGLADELTDCCRSGATRAGELVVMDFFLCHGNFRRPKKKTTPHASFSAMIGALWSYAKLFFPRPGRRFYELHPFFSSCGFRKYWLSFHMLLGKFHGKKTPITPLQGSLGPPKKKKPCGVLLLLCHWSVDPPFRFQKLGESSGSGWDDETSARALNA